MTEIELKEKLLKALETENLHPVNEYQKGYKDALEDLKRELFE